MMNTNQFLNLQKTNLNTNWTFRFSERAEGVTAGGSAYPRSQTGTAAKEW